jgi:ribosomal protein S18 acetylase RimI-like enzyme
VDTQRLVLQVVQRHLSAQRGPLTAAEMLSKPWLMGVRRGWLSLLSPTVHGWDDVFRAFDRLIAFVDNLEEQVRYVRQAPSLVLTDFQKEDAEEIKGLFKKLHDELVDKRRSAEHWFNVAHGNTPSGTFNKEEGETMLTLYETKFGDLLEVHVPTKTNPSKGQWNKTRSAHLTEILDKLLALLRAQAQIINKDKDLTPEVQEDTERQWGSPAFKEFSFGHMKVVVTDPKFHGKLIERYIRWVDAAYQLLENKGFQKLWYGTMFIESDSVEKLSEQEQAGYKALGYKDMRARAGRYHEGADVFYLTQPPDVHIAYSIVHELGHRYWFKFMTSGQRARFEALVKVHPEVKEEKWRPAPNPPLDPSVLHGVLSAIDKHAGEVEKALHKFERSKEGFTRDLDASGYLYMAAHTFAQAVQDERQKLSPWSLGDEETRAWKDVLEATEHLYKFLFKVDTVIKERMNAMSDSEALKYKSPKNPDHLWQTVYEKKLRPEWLAEARSELAITVEKTKGYMTSVFDWYNEKAEKARAEYQKEMGPGVELDAEGFAKDDPRVILPVTEYGRSHIREAFAEVFTHYVYNADMDRDQLESFRSVLSSSSADDLFQAFLALL